MDSVFTTQNITFAIGILAMLFSIFLFFRKPQEDLDKKQALTDKDVESKAGVLAQRLDWERESNEAKFSALSLRMTDAMSIAQNHIHTVDVKVDALIETVSAMGNSITRLSTIIDERIPKK